MLWRIRINKIVLFGVTFVLLGCTTTPCLYQQSPNIAHALSSTLTQHLAILSSDEFLGRKHATVGSNKAQNYIISELMRHKIDAFKQGYRHHFVKKNLIENIKGTNIVAWVQGLKKPEQYIVISAHYDHLGSKGHKIFNGADDNASGTAALLFLAQQIKQQPLDFSVIFLFADAEEVGLVGSKAFVKKHKNIIEKIKLNINLDMISGAKKTHKLHYIEKGLSALLSEKDYQDFSQNNITPLVCIKSGFKQVGLRIKNNKHINYNAASDHGAFYKEKIPFIYYGVGMHNNYHTEHDTFEKTNVNFFIKATISIYQNIRFLSQNLQ